jgi:hypothetical protein
LVEVVVSTLIVGLVLVGALNLVGATVRSGTATSRRVKAALLAEDLMNEILAQYYSSPDEDLKYVMEFTPTRRDFDDVDDYAGWSASPPQEKDGTVIPNTDGWQRRVEVVLVDPADLSTVLSYGDDRGVKRITVNVSYNGELLAALVGIQSEAWLDMIPEPGNDQTTGSKPPVNQAPRAVADGNPRTGQGWVAVDFDATSSTDPEDNPLSYSWDFGDGSKATGPRPSHTYTNYSLETVVRTVTLTATDIHGAVDVDTMTITIYPN